MCSMGTCTAAEDVIWAQCDVGGAKTPIAVITRAQISSTHVYIHFDLLLTGHSAGLA